MSNDTKVCDPGAIPVILNAAAGTGHAEADCKRLRALFAKSGMDADIVTAADGDEIAACVRNALARHPTRIVAGGGDGTVSSVASLLCGTPVALGILPLGTLNHFARDLGIPSDCAAAVEVIAGGHRVPVDVGEVNGRLFINNASLGLYPDMVRDRTSQERRLGRGKYWAMLWATLAALRRSPFMDLRLEIDGNAQDCRSPFVFVGNNDYVMEGFSIGTRSSVRDGRLSVYTTRCGNRGGLIRLALRAVFGRLAQADDFSGANAHSLRVETRQRRMWVATDGEINMMETPLDFHIRPASLQVILPLAPPS